MTPLIRFPRAEFKDLIKELTEAVCLWDDEPVPFLGQIGGKPGYYTTLSVTRTKQLGNVEERLTTDQVRGVNSVVQVTYYKFSIAVHVVSFDKQTPSFDIASQIRRGIRSVPGHDQWPNRTSSISPLATRWIDKWSTITAPRVRALSSSTLCTSCPWIRVGTRARSLRRSVP